MAATNQLTASWQPLKKTPPFSENEVRRLMKLVDRHRNIIECKITNHANNRRKKEIWGTVETEFNQCSEGCYREKDVLKRKYENMKKRAKEKQANEKLNNTTSLGASEVTHLLNIIEDFTEALETGTNSNEIDNIWKDIESRFNNESYSGPFRSYCLLRGEYATLVKNTKRKLTKEKTSLKDTGGGEEEVVHLTQHDHQMSGLLGNRLVGDDAIYDCDFDSFPMTTEQEEFAFPEGEYEVANTGDVYKVPLSENNDVSTIKSTQDKKSVVQNETASTAFESNTSSSPCTSNTKSMMGKWSGNTTPLLKDPKTPCLSKASEPDEGTYRKRHLHNQVSDWAMAKVALNKLQSEAFHSDSAIKRKREEELHEEKKKRDQEIHEEAMLRERNVRVLLEKEIQTRITLMEAKHAKEIELLEIQKCQLLNVPYVPTQEDDSTPNIKSPT